MRIVQLVPSLSYGDGVSNDCIAIKKALLEKGFDTQIYAESISSKVKKGTAALLNKMPELSENDILIYHLASGHHLNFKIDKLGGRKVVRYHNVTPPVFFAGYSKSAQVSSNFGYEGVRHLADKVDYAIAVSEYNKKDLIRMGYQCRIDVMPIVIPFEDYKQEPDKKTLAQYSDGKHNIIFTGRIVPNKSQEDVIQAFHLYKKYYDLDARLILVGNFRGMESYYDRLIDYVKRLGVADVIFTGHISFPKILAFYQTADAFLCMSEHEGFCIPLLEAMYFEVPVLAYDSSAIGETLGGSGILLPEKEPAVAAGWMNRLICDEDLRAFILEKQNVRLKDFTYEAICKKLYECIDEIRKSC